MSTLLCNTWRTLQLMPKLNLVGKSSLLRLTPNIEQIRTSGTGYPGRMMLRDIKRRELIRKYWPRRSRYIMLKNNMILPESFRNYCKEEEFAVFPKETQDWWRWNRCVLTSRQWGVLEDWRVGRIVWRRFADYNQMSGVMRRNQDRYTIRNAVEMSRDRRIIKEDP
ncbi:unnamed protein product [Didymodactylos carnosus]|uniref:Uncharacterized protein n=1 Tax=Didymodactylos carnosus TaxID=1234261 RepID=A0A815B818_9BILA|nr:unnamed protein product [Didymodactylos carnosus]CAF4050626.1 unnamed protein product [Didymodactylos carnosus]